MALFSPIRNFVIEYGVVELYERAIDDLKKSEGTYEEVERECLNCDRKFKTSSRTTRLCRLCKSSDPFKHLSDNE